MKILALTILFILAFSRVRNTPCALSKTLWKNKMIKRLKNNEEQNGGKPYSDEMQGAAILFIFLIELFLIIFYIVLGNKIGTTEFIIMSALQVFTCLWNLWVSIGEFKRAFSYSIEDHKFHRFQLLFNLILDYIYYPYAIYMLLK
ncbi:hypothetical protein MT487_01715 [Lachnospiraceae bacterium NSJ-171]|nr:hypothetical protein [Lachnospiraceae bacterium NSJ-171]